MSSPFPDGDQAGAGPGPAGPGLVGGAGDGGDGGRPEWPDAKWLQPSSRLRLVRRVQLLLVALPILLAAAIAAGAGNGAATGIAVAAAVLVLALVADYFLGRRVRAWGYAARDDDLLVRRGVMFRRLSVIPYGRMQFIDVTAGPVERSFGLATIRMHTAAAASDARVPGLAAAEAARLRDNLTTLGEARAAGL
jgi:membrane protein YdbS with pleckstrin-like domain